MFPSRPWKKTRGTADPVGGEKNEDQDHQEKVLAGVESSPVGAAYDGGLLQDMRPLFLLFEELVFDAINEGLPACLDDVLGYAHGSPLVPFVL